MDIRKPSDIILDFLNLLEKSSTIHDEAFRIVGGEDKKTVDFMHKIEFAENKAERNKVATKFQQSRKVRRNAKDEVLLYENIVKFAGNISHKATIRDLKTVLGLQKQREEYLASERTYKERVADDDY